MIASSSENLPLEKCPALVLNADYRPLSYYPLSLWSWQDAIRDVFLERVNIVSEYDREIRSPSFTMKLPSVISLKSFVKPSEFPNFTRFNVFLRDKFTCLYCGDKKNLTFDQERSPTPPPVAHSPRDKANGCEPSLDFDLALPNKDGSVLSHAMFKIALSMSRFDVLCQDRLCHVNTCQD